MDTRPPLLLRQRGAALLLLIALGGIGASMLLMGALRPDTGDLRNEQQTLNRLAEAREALVGFAAQYGRLPRPAISALDGRESPQPCDNAKSCNGFIPWIALGIEGTDNWGKLLRYSVTPSFTVVPLQAATVGGSKTIISRDEGGRPYYLLGQAGCPLYAQCPPAVLYSSGKNNPGTSRFGIAQFSPSETNFDERLNEAADSDFMFRARSTNPNAPGGEFDDLVTWVSTDLLYARMRAAKVLN